MSKDLNSYLKNKKQPDQHIKNKVDYDPFVALRKSNYKTGFFDRDSSVKRAFEDTTNKDFLSPDYLFNDDTYDTSEMRAYNQGWGSKAIRGVGQFAAKTGLEATKTLGVLGGLIASPFSEGEWTDTAFNNFFIKALEDSEEWIDNEAVPVYVKEAVQNGNLWDKISSIDFWSTEGADGLGFIAAMFAPGAALKSLNVGSKLANAGVKGTKAFNKMIGRSEYIDDAVNTLNKGGNWAGVNADKIDDLGITMFNTLSEAGIEAGHAMKDYEENLDNLYQSGEIDLQEYNNKKANKGELGRNVFLSNIAVLTVPNFINTKMLYGKKGSKQAFEFAKKIQKRKGTKEITGATGAIPKAVQFLQNKYNKFKVTNAKKILDDYGKAFVREGLVEEGGQNTITNYFTKVANGEETTLKQEYLETLGSTEGQVAMFLGTAFGGTMQSITNYKNRKSTDKKYNALAEYANSNIDSFTSALSGDLYERGKNNKIVFEKDPKTGKDKPKLDYNKVFEALNNTESNNRIQASIRLAMLTGQTEQAEAMLEDITTALVAPFALEEELGISVLEDFLKNNDSVATYAEINKITSQEAVQEILNKAKQLQKDAANYNDYSDDVINFDKYQGKVTEEEFDKLKQRTQSTYIHIKGRKAYLDKKLDSTNEELDKIKREKNLQDEDLSKQDDKRIKQLLENKKQIEEAITENKNATEAIWDGKTLDKFYKDALNKKVSKEEAETTAKKGEEIAEEINKATTPKRLNELNDEEYAKFVKDVKLIREISDSVKEDYSSKNLKTQLAKLKQYLGKIPSKLTKEQLKEKAGAEPNTLEGASRFEFFDSKMIERILQEQINEIESKKEEFSSLMKNINDNLTKKNKELSDKLELAKEELEKEIEKLLKSIDLFNNVVEDAPLIGRNAKINRELIEEDKRRISLLKSNVRELQTRVKELQKEKETTDNTLRALDSVFEDILRKEFVDVKDFQDFLFENLEYLKGIDTSNYSEMDALGLATNKLYIDEELQNNKEAIDELNYTIGFLELMQEEQLESSKKTANKNKKINQYQNKINESKAKVEELEERQKELKDKKYQVEVKQKINDITTLVTNLKDIKDFENSQANLLRRDSYLAKVLNAKNEELDRAIAEYENKLYNNAERNEEINDELLDDAKKLFSTYANKEKGDKFVVSAKHFPNSSLAGQEVIFQFYNSNTKEIKLQKADDKGKSVFLKYPGDNKDTNITQVKPSSDTNTEGGYTAPTDKKTAQEILDDIPELESGVTAESNSRLGITVGDGKTTLKGVPKSAIGYEKNGENKTDDTHSISLVELKDIDTTVESGKLMKQALDEYKKNGVTSENISELIDYLPIRLDLVKNKNNEVSTFGVLFTKPTKGSTATYGNTSRNLRRRIMQELLTGKPISDIYVKIAGQKNGQINIAPKKDGKVQENSLLALKEMGNDIKNLKSEDIYLVNEKGFLQNNKGDYFPGNVNRGLARGELYLKVTMPSGKQFPLKLNIQRVNETQAEALFELYKFRMSEVKNNDKSILFSEIPADVQKRVKKLLGSELTDLANMMNETESRLTLKDIIDFYIWDGTRNTKSVVNIAGNNRFIRVGSRKIYQSQLDKESGKKLFIDFMTNANNNNEGKRRHIQFKKTKGNRKLNFDNRRYVEYLINKKILNTNVNTKEDTFVGDTSMYLDNNIYIGENKVNSEFNETRVIKAKRGTKRDLKKLLKSLFSKSIGLARNNKFYSDNTLVETDGQRQRVSSLYPQKTNDEFDIEADESSYMAAKRGDVVDSLVREFFEKRLTFEQFLKSAEKTIQYINTDKKRKFKNVEFTSEAIESLYNILIEYDNYFAENNMTIFSSELTLWNDNRFGKFGKTKGYAAGTTDLVAYDNDKQKWIIIDIKTSSVRLEDLYDGALDDKFNVVEKHKYQQNAYKEMFEQITGETPEIHILPLHIPKPKLGGATKYVYKNINKSKKGLLLDIDQSKTIYDLLGVKKEIPKPQPKAESKSESTSEPSRTVDTSRPTGQVLTKEEEEDVKDIVNTIFRATEGGVRDNFITSYTGPKPTLQDKIKLLKKHEFTLLPNLDAETSSSDVGSQNKTVLAALVKYNNYYVVFIIDQSKDIVILQDIAEIEKEINKRMESTSIPGLYPKFSQESLKKLMDVNRIYLEKNKSKVEKVEKKSENNTENTRNSQKNSVSSQEGNKPKSLNELMGEFAREEEEKENSPSSIDTSEMSEEEKASYEMYFGNGQDMVDKREDNQPTSVADPTKIKKEMDLTDMSEEDILDNLSKLIKNYINVFKTNPAKRNEILELKKNNPKKALEDTISYLVEKENINKNEIENICKR